MRKFLLAVVLILQCVAAEAARFVPEQLIMPVREIRPGMTGYIMTVLKGYTPERLPVKVVSVAPQKPGRELSDEILIRLTGKHKFAQGMSGSPVYINGRLIGAVRSGWNLSDHKLGMVAPIESMCNVFEYGSPSLPLADFMISGLSLNNSAVCALADTMGLTFMQGAPLSSQPMTISRERLKPGDSVSALLAWGDVEIGAVGTVTATARDGRFLAFGHEMNKAGKSSYPAAKTYIHETVDSIRFPFKLGSPETIVGTFTEDREAATGGKFGVYPPSISAELVFKNLDNGTEAQSQFRVIVDEFMSREIIVKVFQALVEECWGRKGQGTMSVSLRIDGPAVPKGWARKDIFFSDSNIFEEAFKDVQALINAYMIQPFEETMPAGFTLTVEATQRPKVLLIEDVTLSEDTVEPGGEVGVTVKLRGWRTGIVERSFTMKMPDDASEGVCELIVRGGGTEPMSQLSVDEGWKSIDSIERMLTEFKAADANNDLVLELNADKDDALKKALARRRSKKREPDLLPEEEEYMSETKERRISEGTLRVFKADYIIEGMMKRIIHVEK
ncbi:MAG: hypothetical protein IJT02_02465 [Synergistaceae bacterium]|nr:hypothetical protein [Synergistaceae bacterium]